MIPQMVLMVQGQDGILLSRGHYHQVALRPELYSITWRVSSSGGSNGSGPGWYSTVFPREFHTRMVLMI
jgi:hypothetical protein